MKVKFHVSLTFALDGTMMIIFCAKFWWFFKIYLYRLLFIDTFIPLVSVVVITTHMDMLRRRGSIESVKWSMHFRWIFIFWKSVQQANDSVRDFQYLMTSSGRLRDGCSKCQTKINIFYHQKIYFSSVLGNFTQSLCYVNRVSREEVRSFNFSKFLEFFFYQNPKISFSFQILLNQDHVYSINYNIYFVVGVLIVIFIQQRVHQGETKKRMLKIVRLIFAIEIDLSQLSAEDDEIKNEN